MAKIRLLIVDDHDIVRGGLKALISSDPNLELVGEAANGAQAVELTSRLNPDIILLDLVMPGMDGLEAIHHIMHKTPEARILILTSFSDDDKVFPAIKAGAMGYLLKESSHQQLLGAIYDVYHGEASLHPSIALKVMRELKNPSGPPFTENPLTEREVDVLKLVAKGLSNQQIAEQLVISQQTVRTHIRNILSKLHLANRTQAALYALREGLASLKNMD